MKLLRFGKNGSEKPGMLVNGNIVDTSLFTEDYNEAFFESDGIARLKRWYKENKAEITLVDPATVRLGAPISRPSKIICVGLNYRKHAAESNMAIPTEPIIFFKATTALCGPNDDIIIPRNSKKTDWEVELAVVIGRRASYIEERDGMKHVAGFCLHNDYSERDFQLERNGQWVKGKSCDTFGPMGPYLVTAEEIEDYNNLSMQLKVNGRIYQNGNTDDMIFKVPYLVSYISQFMTLLPGDVISTGTPAGVGLGQSPPLYLNAGDEVELSIDHLGTQKQKLISYSPVFAAAVL